MNVKFMNKPSLELIAYIEMYVGNIFQSKSYFVNALKFSHISTKSNGKTITFLMKQGEVNILLTSSLEKNTAVSNHVLEYGDSIKKISFWVHNVTGCFEQAVKYGAKSIFKPEYKDGAHISAVEVFNEVEHEFIDIDTGMKSLPGFDSDEVKPEESSMLLGIDHIATCHPKGGVDRWAKFYKDAFLFAENKSEDIYSEESGMHITIMNSPNGKIKLPLVEPSSDKSPLNTYLKYNSGAGIHHIAFQTNNIIEAVKHYEKKSGELRKAPLSYYDELKESHPNQVAILNKLADHGIMLEEDEKGILFQIFTKPIVTKPTLFLEFIQRDKCEGFGTVNIKTLYESLES